MFLTNKWRRKEMISI